MNKVAEIGLICLMVLGVLIVSGVVIVSGIGFANWINSII